MKKTLFGALALITVIGVIAWIARPKPTKAAAVQAEFAAATRAYSKGDASSERSLRAFVDRHADDPAPKVQDQVGAARMKLGYLAAKHEDLPAARETFLQTEREYKGAGASNPDYGTIKDQAAYQAIVVLVAEHKEQEAEKEFVRFMKERPLSPLVYACQRRLQRLNHGQSKPEWDALLQEDISAQERRARFETSVCGPKTIAYLLQQPSFQKFKRAPDAPKDYEAIAKLCGTTESGTTIEGMQRGLKAMGIVSYPCEVNRKDFASLEAPFILLVQSHYYAVLRIEKDHALMFDTFFNDEFNRPLPELDDPDFKADVIVFATPKFLSRE